MKKLIVCEALPPIPNLSNGMCFRGFFPYIPDGMWEMKGPTQHTTAGGQMQLYMQDIAGGFFKASSLTSQDFTNYQTCSAAPLFLLHLTNCGT